MKRKHHGIIVVAVALAAMTAIGVYALTGEWQKTDAGRRMPPQAAVHIKVPSEQQVRQMDRLMDRLPMLAAPGKRLVEAKELTLFGYQAPALDEDGKARRESENLEQSGFQLSLVVLAGVGRYCILDGNLVSEGTQMEDGTAILKIESHRVLVARKKERRWIYLEDATVSSSTTEPKDTSGQQRGQS